MLNGVSDIGLFCYNSAYFSMFGDFTAETNPHIFLYVVPKRKVITPIRNILLPLDSEVWAFFGASLLLATGVFVLYGEAEKRQGSKV